MYMVKELFDKYQYLKYYVASVCYVIFSLFLGFFLGNGLVIFLGWNMILATSVIFFAQLIKYIIENKKPKFWLVITTILWVLFFPNTFYILTDFIHFQAYTFFDIYPDIYAFHLSDWLVFGHIVIGALYAFKLGILAIDFLIIYIKKYHWIILSLLFLASSFGIYLGRFIRLNSWDIFKIDVLVNAIFHDFSFMIMFAILFYFIHLISYILFGNKSFMIRKKLEDLS